MGARKRIRAEKIKEAKKTQYFARLNNCPTSPRKMRLVGDMVKGKDIETALNMLQHSPKEAAGRMYKLLLSAIANWQAKNEGEKLEDHLLYVKEVTVDSARMLKRIQTAPQGRAHRIRKRSNHVTLTLGSKNEHIQEMVENIEENEK
ncbi:MAG: 50S ribosomal protein L22 [Bacteroidales bacterium]